jgi:hypothetical protein
MKQISCSVLSLLAALLIVTGLSMNAGAQSGSQGTIAVVVTDTSGGVVPGAALQLTDTATNDIRKGETRAEGGYTFVNLPIGEYRLSVSRPGYQNEIVAQLIVHAALTTDVNVALAVGRSNQTVEVNASAASLLESSSNAIGTVVDLKQIEDLPLAGRDLTQLATYTAGYGGDNGGTSVGAGEWNGQPRVSQGTNIDGTIGSSSRMKIFGNIEPAVTPRIEDISEMTVQTDQLDLDQGFGQALMQSNFVTRRGSNRYHGRVFNNFRNDGLNANTVHPRQLYRDQWISDFGGAGWEFHVHRNGRGQLHRECAQHCAQLFDQSAWLGQPHREPAIERDQFVIELGNNIGRVGQEHQHSHVEQLEYEYLLFSLGARRLQRDGKTAHESFVDHDVQRAAGRRCGSISRLSFQRLGGRLQNQELHLFLLCRLEHVATLDQPIQDWLPV